MQNWERLYGGASYIRTPEIWGLQLTDDFFLETDCLNVILYLLLIYPIFRVLNPDDLFLP